MQMGSATQSALLYSLCFNGHSQVVTAKIFTLRKHLNCPNGCFCVSFCKWTQVSDSGLPVSFCML